MITLFTAGTLLRMSFWIKVTSYAVSVQCMSPVLSVMAGLLAFLFVGCPSEFIGCSLPSNSGFWKIVRCKTQVTSTSDVRLLQD